MLCDTRIFDHIQSEFRCNRQYSRLSSFIPIHVFSISLFIHCSRFPTPTHCIGRRTSITLITIFWLNAFELFMLSIEFMLFCHRPSSPPHLSLLLLTTCGRSTFDVSLSRTQVLTSFYVLKQKNK